VVTALAMEAAMDTISVGRSLLDTHSSVLVLHDVDASYLKGPNEGIVV
jgi:hypothetical protein